MPANPVTEPRLTSLSHGGGCGCKIAPGVLSEILKTTTAMPLPPELMVGIETADDAAVYRLNAHQALIATTDFFMPIVDDPFDFGRIAATDAISRRLCDGRYAHHGAGAGRHADAMCCPLKPVARSWQAVQRTWQGGWNTHRGSPYHRLGGTHLRSGRRSV
jgi:hypothetical protein